MAAYRNSHLIERSIGRDLFSIWPLTAFPSEFRYARSTSVDRRPASRRRCASVATNHEASGTISARCGWRQLSQEAENSGRIFLLMSRPERDRPEDGRSRCCTRLTGASPVAVSAGAPRSRLRAWEEIPASERSVKSPVWDRRVPREGSKPAGPMRERELCSPVRKETERWSGRADHATAKATDCALRPERHRTLPGYGRGHVGTV